MAKLLLNEAEAPLFLLYRVQCRMLSLEKLVQWALKDVASSV